MVELDSSSSEERLFLPVLVKIPSPKLTKNLLRRNTHNGSESDFCCVEIEDCSFILFCGVILILRWCNREIA